MKCRYEAPRPATWTFDIVPYEADTKGLYEAAPYDEKTRAEFQLVKSIQAWLAEHEHHLSIDRGGFGDGPEFFYITLYDQEHADAFSRLCDGLRDA